MDNIIKFPSERRADEGAPNAESPWLGSNLYAGQQTFEVKERATALELLEVEKLGAGKHGVNPLKAPSWLPLMTVKRKHRTLREVLTSISETGHGGEELNAWGVQCVAWRAAEVELVVSLEADSKAGPLFLKAGAPQWRKAIAHDSAALKLERPEAAIFDFDHFVKAWAYFTLPRLDKD